MARKGRMNFSDAMALVPDDLPDGAFFAMAHEIAGLDYGDGFDELAHGETGPAKEHHCSCGKQFATTQSRDQHRRAKGHR